MIIGGNGIRTSFETGRGSVIIRGVTNIENTSKDNLIKVLPKFDGITLRVAKLDDSILSHCKKLKVILSLIHI